MAAPAIPSGLKVSNELDANNINITPKILLTWTANTEVDITKYIIYRNYAPYGTFTQIAEVTHPSVTYEDSPVLETIPAVIGDSQGIAPGLDGFWYYRIAAVNSGAEASNGCSPVTYEENEAFDSSPFGTTVLGPQTITYSPDEPSDLPDNEDMKEYFGRIRTHALWQLQQDGQDVLLFKRKVEGIKCPFWQDDAQQCLHPLGVNSTDVCYNTGVTGGYFPGLKIRVRIVPAGGKILLEREGTRVSMSPRSWTIWTPRMSNFDFIVTSDGSRYEITNVTNMNARGGLITHQEFDTIKKWPTDLLYKVPVTEILR